MATESTPTDESLTGNQRVVLDAIQRNFRYVADVLDYCGPRFEEGERGMDSATYTIVIEELVTGGYLERARPRGTSQLRLALTEKGRSAAPELSDLDVELLDGYGVTAETLGVLREAIEFESREGDLPAISQLVSEHGTHAAYQYTLHFNALVDAGLADERGIIRYRLEPTETGRELVEEHGDRL